MSDHVPSEAAYYRMISKIENAHAFEESQDVLLSQAMTEGFISDDTIAIDATHFEARDQASPKEEKPKPEPKKRGRKSKEEREQWLVEREEHEAHLPITKRRLKLNLMSP